MEEIWKDIKGYEGLYQISSFGRVKSFYANREKILKFKNNKSGYLYAQLCGKGKNKYYRVHRLVASAFIPNIKKFKEVNHKDGDKTNNYVSNLDWCSMRMNRDHSFKLGLYPTKLSVNDVVKIKSLLRSGRKNIYDISKQFDVSRAAIYNIKRGKTWKHI